MFDVPHGSLSASILQYQTNLYRALLAYIVMHVVSHTAWRFARHGTLSNVPTGEAANVRVGENLPRIFCDGKRLLRSRYVATAAAAPTSRSGRGYARGGLGGIGLLFSQGGFVRHRSRMMPLLVWMPPLFILVLMLLVR